MVFACLFFGFAGSRTPWLMGLSCELLLGLYLQLSKGFVSMGCSPASGALRMSQSRTPQVLTEDPHAHTHTQSNALKVSFSKGILNLKEVHF